VTLAKGDHVVIKRNGKILTEADEAYHEFEVLENPNFLGRYEGAARYEVVLQVVK